VRADGAGQQSPEKYVGRGLRTQLVKEAERAMKRWKILIGTLITCGLFLVVSAFGLADTSVTVHVEQSDGTSLSGVEVFIRTVGSVGWNIVNGTKTDTSGNLVVILADGTYDFHVRYNWTVDGQYNVEVPTTTEVTFHTGEAQVKVLNSSNAPIQDVSIYWATDYPWCPEWGGNAPTNGSGIVCFEFFPGSNVKFHALHNYTTANTPTSGYMNIPAEQTTAINFNTTKTTVQVVDCHGVGVDGVEMRFRTPHGMCPTWVGPVDTAGGGYVYYEFFPATGVLFHARDKDFWTTESITSSVPSTVTFHMSKIQFTKDSLVTVQFDPPKTSWTTISSPILVFPGTHQFRATRLGHTTNFLITAPGGGSCIHKCVTILELEGNPSGAFARIDSTDYIHEDLLVSDFGATLGARGYRTIESIAFYGSVVSKVADGSSFVVPYTTTTVALDGASTIADGSAYAGIDDSSWNAPLSTKFEHGDTITLPMGAQITSYGYRELRGQIYYGEKQTKTVDGSDLVIPFKTTHVVLKGAPSAPAAYAYIDFAGWASPISGPFYDGGSFTLPDRASIRAHGYREMDGITFWGKQYTKTVDGSDLVIEYETTKVVLQGAPAGAYARIDHQTWALPLSDQFLDGATFTLPLGTSIKAYGYTPDGSKWSSEHSKLIDGTNLVIGYCSWFDETAPAIASFPGQEGEEGSAITFTVSASDNCDSSLEYRWDFDNNGTWDTGWLALSSASNAWNDDYTGTVKVEVKDDYGNTSTDTCTVTVNNVAPTATATTDPVVVDEGDTAVNSGTISDPGDDTVSSVAASVGTITSFNDSSWNWEYLTTDGTDDSQVVTITVTDSDGASSTVDFQLTVNNVAPDVAALAGDTIDEGDTYTESGSFTDPGADTWTATVDYGDGSGVQALTLAGKAFDLGHTYADNGVYTVTVVVTDDDAGFDTETCTVTVNNVAPDVDAGTDQTVAEGDIVLLDPATFNDLGTLDTHTATIDWGDGNLESGVVTESPFGPPGSTLGMDGTVTGSHAYGDDGIYIVTVTVDDDDGASTSDTFEVTVGNVSPTLTVVSNQAVDEGVLLDITNIGQFTDPAFADTLLGNTKSFSYEIDWGDGTAFDTGTAAIDTIGSTGVLTAGSFDGSHVYADNGVYTVEIVVTDDDLGWALESFQVTVSNVAPTVEAGANQSVNEGDVVNLDPATFNDLGTLDTHTATIDWGDGTAVDVGVVTEARFGPPGNTAGMNGSVAGSHVYFLPHASFIGSFGGYTVTVTVTDDDGMSTSDTFVVTVHDIGEPDVAFTSTPPDPDHDASPRFEWEGNDAHSLPENLVYSQRLDGGLWSEWSDPDETTAYLGPLSDGIHTFEVRVRDEAGNVGLADIYTWFVDLYEVLPGGTAGGGGGFDDGGYSSFFYGDIDVAGGGGVATIGLEVDAVFEQGSPIGISFTLFDDFGVPITDAIVTVTIVAVTITEGGEEYVVGGLFLIPFMEDAAAYDVQIPTLTEDYELDPGIYDLWLGFDDGTQIKLRIELVATVEE